MRRVIDFGVASARAATVKGMLPAQRAAFYSGFVYDKKKETDVIIAKRIIDGELSKDEVAELIVKLTKVFFDIAHERITEEKSGRRREIVGRYNNTIVDLLSGFIGEPSLDPIAECFGGMARIFCIESEKEEKARGLLVVAAHDKIPLGRMFIADAPIRKHLTMLQVNNEVAKALGLGKNPMPEIVANMIKAYCKKRKMVEEDRVDEDCILRRSCVGYYDEELRSMLSSYDSASMSATSSLRLGNLYRLANAALARSESEKSRPDSVAESKHFVKPLTPPQEKLK